MNIQQLFNRRKVISCAVSLALLAMSSATIAEELTLLHVGDQESWLLSAQGNLRDNAAQAISFYGGIDRLATVIKNAETNATNNGHFVLKLNAGDSFLPGPRLTASFNNLSTAYTDGGQDFYDTIAMRKIGFHATVFGNHEFDLGPTIAARFAEVSGTTYLSSNLNFEGSPEFSALKSVGIVAASKVVTTTGGKKIGIVGATTPLLPTISSPGAVNLIGYSASNTDAENLQALFPIIQAEIDNLRNNQGVTAIIVMSHLQNADNERNAMVPFLKNVDLVISGGGHELMSDPDDLLINGGVAPTYTTHPIYANDADGKSVAIVTGHFGNRYVGELNATIDDTSGKLTSINSTHMIRVTGAATDADKVLGDTSINADVIIPVSNYIAALNAQVIGTSATKLNGPTHVSCAALPCTYTAGVRNAETGLGNLVADAMRFAGNADVAIQNGGGIRTSVSVPGNVSIGDTFNILPFTNLVKRAPSVNATQLKDLLEHAYGATSPVGAANGRYAQISGMKVTYKSNNTARTTIGTGNRIQRVVLDNGTILINNGVVVDNAATFSFSTIDFTASGGDGYPFAENNVIFENAVNTVTYQQALASLIQTPKSEGGLGRSNVADGDEVTTNMYGIENAYDLHGRLIDLAIAQPELGTVKTGTSGRDILIGTNGDDVITGGLGVDMLTGGAGGDTFVYNSMREAGDIITDFTPYADKIDLSGLLLSFGINNISNAIAGGYIKVADAIGGASLQIDSDGIAGSAGSRTLTTLKGLTATQFVPARDITFNLPQL